VGHAQRQREDHDLNSILWPMIEISALLSDKFWLTRATNDRSKTQTQLALKISVLEEVSSRNSYDPDDWVMQCW